MSLASHLTVIMGDGTSIAIYATQCPCMWLDSHMRLRCGGAETVYSIRSGHRPLASGPFALEVMGYDILGNSRARHPLSAISQRRRLSVCFKMKAICCLPNQDVRIGLPRVAYPAAYENSPSAALK